MNRRLAAAVSLSLGGHAVLLAVIGFGLPWRPEPLIFNQRHPGSLSVSVSLQDTGRTIDQSLPDSADISKSAEEVEKTDSASPADSGKPDESHLEPSDKRAVSEKTDLQSVEASESAAGSEGVEAAASPRLPESSGGASSGSPSPPADTDPVLLSSLDPVYPMMARRAGLEGVVIIEVTVDRLGNPVDYSIRPPRSHRLLEESAVAAVMNARFQPGIRAGVPVQESFRVKVRFELKS